jgi:hypothetical protein
MKYIGRKLVLPFLIRADSSRPPRLLTASSSLKVVW